MPPWSFILEVRTQPKWEQNKAHPYFKRPAKEDNFPLPFRGNKCRPHSELALFQDRSKSSWYLKQSAKSFPPPLPGDLSTIPFWFERGREGWSQRSNMCGRRESSTSLPSFFSNPGAMEASMKRDEQPWPISSWENITSWLYQCSKFVWSSHNQIWWASWKMWCEYLAVCLLLHFPGIASGSSSWLFFWFCWWCQLVANTAEIGKREGGICGIFWFEKKLMFPHFMWPNDALSTIQCFCTEKEVLLISVS